MAKARGGLCDPQLAWGQLVPISARAHPRTSWHSPAMPAWAPGRLRGRAAIPAFFTISQSPAISEGQGQSSRCSSSLIFVWALTF